ncbi:MAG: DEAD/DEAH box helicase [Dehalococcoidia bacterium]
MDAAAFLDYLLTLTEYQQQIVHIERIPPQDATPGKLDARLHPDLQTCLESLGISTLYSHQAKAVNVIFGGNNVIIATPSASGKTLCYHLSTLDALLRDKSSRALYIFPTKALAQDQLRSLQQIARPLSLRAESDVVPRGTVATFDGDTPRNERANIRRRARIVLTNPDMLHLGILPNHQSWAGFLRNLKYVVIDETHIYRGVFGSHVANVLRRLRRLCSSYGSNPQFICSSATIANPQEHAQNIVGLPFEAIIEDGSPHGEKYFIFWNPPFLDEARTSRRSPNSEAASLLSGLVQKGIRGLVFARTRKLTELIYIYTKGQLSPTLADRISPYRAGYLPQDRRRIERQFFDGELLGLVATTALELGINVGDLEATVLTGYPGSIASAWQQAGRSGRSTHSSLSFLVAHENPLDQYLMHNPDFFFSKNFDNAIINPGNPYILKPHLLCAAWEKPLHDEDEAFFGANIGTMLTELEQEAKLRKRHHRWYPVPSIAYPAQDINIRAASGENYAVIDAGQGCLLETVEASVAFFQVHPGAIYLHQGESYLVKELDLVRHIAWVEPSAADYYTQSMDITDLRVASVTKERNCRRVQVYFGDVDVTTTVVGFKRKKQLTEEVIAEEPLDLPPQNFRTRALWFDLPQGAISRIADGGLDLQGGLHACEHAAIGLLPLFALCDRNDIGGVSTALHPDTGKAQIFIYDAYPGGIGIVEKGFEMMTELWQATLKAVEACPCAEGCPSCVQSPKCGNNNQPLDKEAAIVLLQELAA